jgi:polysaccharide pyruvyl transferase WcaK-like protein
MPAIKRDSSTGLRNCALARFKMPSLNKNAGDSGHLARRNTRRPGATSDTCGPRIALLTPYSGNNLGDAAIQDAMIANLRLRLTGAQFSGISLNCENFLEHHGSGAFPLCVTTRPFYGMSGGSVANQPREAQAKAAKPSQKSFAARFVTRVPGLRRSLKAVHLWMADVRRELRHSIEGYRFLRTQDLLVVSGGGQLDEEWGGPWGHPLALFKWGVLAGIARVPFAMASVGACKVTSGTSRFLLRTALRFARYRSYRDQNSKEIAARILPSSLRDSVVPDLAFSMPPAELPPPAGIRLLAQGRRVIAISPIGYARPQSWPHEDCALYDRYLQQLAQVISCLLERGDFVVIVLSAFSDERVIPELIERLDEKSKKRLLEQMHVPSIATWKDLAASLLDVDFLIASRLHSTILGFATNTPTIAISFDPKVDWVMQDLGQTDYLLQIGDFTAEDVIRTLDRITLRRDVVLEQIASYQRGILSVSALQYDRLAELARVSSRCSR